MKRMVFLSVLLLIALSSLYIAKEGEGDAKAGGGNKRIIYQAMWSSDNVSGDVFVNGFLISDFKGPQSAGTSPLNPLLIGKNEIRTEIRKADKSKPAHFSFGVSELNQGDIAATNDRGNVLSIELKDNDFKPSGIIRIQKKFESTFNFNSHLSGTGNATEKEVINYAKKIYGLFQAKNAEGIIKEFKVKISDYSIAYSSDNFAAEFKSYLTKDLLGGKLLKINPLKLKAKKTGPNKNLWLVFDGDKELIRIASGDGSTTEMSMYIGMVDGKLQVIR